MRAITSLRKDVQKYIETADDRVVKMIHAMLSADSKTNLLYQLPKANKNDAAKKSYSTNRKDASITNSLELNKRKGELSKAFDDITLHEAGKKRLKPAKDLLNEL